MYIGHFSSNHTSNLLEAFDTILDMIDDGLPVDVLFFDFKKAFDTVPHYRLLVKLESFGINGSTFLFAVLKVARYPQIGS